MRQHNGSGKFRRCWAKGTCELSVVDRCQRIRRWPFRRCVCERKHGSDLQTVSTSRLEHEALRRDQTGGEHACLHLLYLRYAIPAKRGPTGLMPRVRRRTPVHPTRGAIMDNARTAQDFAPQRVPSVRARAYRRWDDAKVCHRTACTAFVHP